MRFGVRLFPVKDQEWVWQGEGKYLNEDTEWLGCYDDGAWEAENSALA
jgi:hypothetical protein